jgi:hypothetical protein
MTAPTFARFQRSTAAFPAKAYTTFFTFQAARIESLSFFTIDYLLAEGGCSAGVTRQCFSASGILMQL